jgi:hypothetical protein
MQALIRIVHVLALGLWFGSSAFFSFFTALPIIRHMQDLAARENWLNLQSKEAGTRAAGEALGAVFRLYFPLQVVCGVLALGTALWWILLPAAVHKLRAGLLALALLLVLGNTLYLSPRVHELREQRYSADSAVADRAHQDFGTWHNYSLFTDLATLLLVALALALAAFLPERQNT